MPHTPKKTCRLLLLLRSQLLLLPLSLLLLLLPPASSSALPLPPSEIEDSLEDYFYGGENAISDEESLEPEVI